MTIEDKISWKPHIHKLKQNCQQRLNILKPLGQETWGAHRDSLLQIYQSLIRSKLEYGSVVFNVAKKSLLNTVDPIQNTATRIATGAYRISPVNSLLCDSGQHPLYLRLSQQLLTYATNLLNNSKNPVTKESFSNYILPQINRTPFQTKITHCLNVLNINLPIIKKA